MAGLLVVGDGASAVLRELIVLALHGTALVAATAVLVFGVDAIGRWRRRGPAPALLAALWSVAIIKFVLPVGPALRWSLSDLLTTRSPAALPAFTLDVPMSTVVAPAVTAGPSTTSIVLAALMVALLAVMVAVAARRIIRLTLGHARATRTAQAWSLAPVAAQAELGEVARHLGVRAPRMRVAGSGSPYVVGTWRPTLVVPTSILVGPSDLRRAALAHELAHVRRRDPAQQLVIALISALFWWWPPVAWAARRLDGAREAACDAWALEVTRVEVGRYARMLVHHARAPRPVLATTAFLGAPRPAVEQRIGGLLRGVGPARLGPWRAALLLPWALIALAGARATAAPLAEPGLVCVFTPEIAESLLAAYPEADDDGDGELSRGEACDFEAELRRREVGEVAVDDQASEDPGLEPVEVADASSAEAADAATAAVDLGELQLASARALLEDSTACCKCRADGGNTPGATGATSSTSTRCSVSIFDRRSEGVSP